MQIGKVSGYRPYIRKNDTNTNYQSQNNSYNTQLLKNDNSQNINFAGAGKTKNLFLSGILSLFSWLSTGCKQEVPKLFNKKITENGITIMNKFNYAVNRNTNDTLYTQFYLSGIETSKGVLVKAGKGKDERLYLVSNTTLIPNSVATNTEELSKLLRSPKYKDMPSLNDDMAFSIRHKNIGEDMKPVDIETYKKHAKEKDVLSVLYVEDVTGTIPKETLDKLDKKGLVKVKTDFSIPSSTDLKVSYPNDKSKVVQGSDFDFYQDNRVKL